MTYKTCQNWLAGIWVLFFVLQVGLLVLRSIAGAGDSDESPQAFKIKIRVTHMIYSKSIWQK